MHCTRLVIYRMRLLLPALSRVSASAALRTPAATGDMCLTGLRLVCDCCVLACNAGRHDVRQLGQPDLVHALRDRVRASKRLMLLH